MLQLKRNGFPSNNQGCLVLKFVNVTEQMIDLNLSYLCLRESCFLEYKICLCFFRDTLNILLPQLRSQRRKYFAIHSDEKNGNPICNKKKKMKMQWLNITVKNIPSFYLDYVQSWW